MSVERDLELLDDYLANRLNGEDKTAFEKQLEADPELRNEFQVQQKLIEGLKQARITELKSMLSNTPVPPIHGGETAALTKIAAWVVVAGLVGTGLYFYFTDEEKQQSVIPPSVQEEKNVAPVEVPKNNKEEIPAIAEDNAATNKEEMKVSKLIAKKEKSASSGTPSKVEQPKLDVYDPTKELENTDASKIDTTPNVSVKTLAHSSIVIEAITNSKKYSFHYQFKEGRLFLYGPFEKNLYEIMEFFANDKQRLFLFYRNNYYHLNDDTDKIKPLATINDPVLLKKLKEYRGN